MSHPGAGFAAQVVQWQRRFGRSHLPWQNCRDPYRVWLSEIMLQQTQVSTVLGYYERFLQRFADVRALAQAPLDDVLALWSGLGYYSRARNLHRCAQEVVARHGGHFPRSAQALAQLPGIGPSTAAAIAAFCFDERAAILDGNVKRVIARVLAFEGDIARTAQQRLLWQHAASLLPAEAAGGDMPAYTQGLMDLGATVCLPRQPLCDACPVETLCQARRQGEPARYPVKSRTLRRTSQSLWLLQAHSAAGAVWLEKRPVPGVWAGLYCLPIFDTRAALDDALPLALRPGVQERGAFVHALTHKDLHLHACEISADFSADWRAQPSGDWFRPAQWRQLGLPAPVRRLLEQAAG